MQVGDLVKHWRCDHGLGIITDTRDTGEGSCKVSWPDGEWGWYTADRLEVVCK